MSPVEKGIVRRKLAVIIENLKALEPIKVMSKEDYIEDIYIKKGRRKAFTGIN